MRKRKTLDVKKIGNMLLINDELYEPIWTRQRKTDELLRFKKIDKKKFNQLKVKISEKLKSQLSSKDVIQNALADLSLRALERIEKELEKVKPKIRKRFGCYEMEVGKTIIPIR